MPQEGQDVSVLQTLAIQAVADFVRAMRNELDIDHRRVAVAATHFEEGFAAAERGLSNEPSPFHT